MYKVHIKKSPKKNIIKYEWWGESKNPLHIRATKIPNGYDVERSYNCIQNDVITKAAKIV